MRRMFTPKSKAWEHAHQDIPHLTLWAAQDPSPSVLQLREALQALQDLDLPIKAIEPIFDALKAAYKIGARLDSDLYGNKEDDTGRIL